MRPDLHEGGHLVTTSDPCRLGYEEHDGSRYCFAHAGFTVAGSRSLLCDRAMSDDRTEQARS